MMGIDEAIYHSQSRAKADCSECAKEHLQLAEWLNELKQYWAFGTVEELREAKEKQRAKKPLGGDLISRSALMQHLRGNVLVDVTPELEKAIEKEPTAYDVDKVVEQITNMHFDFAEVSSNKYRVLKIVKAGGVNK